jgi:hypothetical protein
MSGSSRIRLDGDIIRYRSRVYVDWDVRVSDVRLIGECTNQDGPFADDYFFCFATGPAVWFEASFYADGRDEVLSALEATLGSPLLNGLCHSTDFASRVLWPPTLCGLPMFQYTDVPAPGLFRRLLGIRYTRRTYSERVAALLAGDKPDAARDRDQDRVIAKSSAHPDGPSP